MEMQNVSHVFCVCVYVYARTRVFRCHKAASCVLMKKALSLILQLPALKVSLLAGVLQHFLDIIPPPTILEEVFMF